MKLEPSLDNELGCVNTFPLFAVITISTVDKNEPKAAVLLPLRHSMYDYVRVVLPKVRNAEVSGCR